VSSYKVMVDDNFHYMDEDERYELGIFGTAEEAVAACKRIVDEYLMSAYKTGIAEEELLEGYKSFGQDPFIVAIDQSDKAVHFSSWDYAKEQCKALASNASKK
jgi:hypothetical protein